MVNLMDEEIKLCLDKNTDAIYRSLLAEVNQPSPKKGEVLVRIENNFLILTIRSNDISKLRAISNSYFHIIYASYSSLL